MFVGAAMAGGVGSEGASVLGRTWRVVSKEREKGTAGERKGDLVSGQAGVTATQPIHREKVKSLMGLMRRLKIL